MVCEDCEGKLNKVICQDVWKDGARNTTESGGRITNENKMLTKQKRSALPHRTDGRVESI